jgi:hypothetical protein
VGGEGAHRSDDDHEQQRADEEVGGDEEGGAGVLDAAHVDQGEDEQDGEAEASVWGWSRGKAETSAPTPAEMPTAALRM